ncbi:MAG TPA: YCF48-related protein [Chitinophagales bacterium]|nr:YCF48-related protein [Chitinophagales bacterium]
MKHLFFFLLALGWMQSTSAQWTVLNSTTTSDLYDVEFLNNDYGIAVGDGGTILKTIDGGATWTDLNFSGPDNFNAVALSGTDTIYAAGTGTLMPTVYRSGDGGVSWQKVLLDATTLSICTSPDGDVFAAAENIYHSQDGGENWLAPYVVAPTVSAFTIQAAGNQTVHMGANVGGIITYSAIMARTENGGNSFWDFDVFSFPNANALSAFSFTDPDTGYLFMNDYDFFSPNDSSQLIRVFNFQLMPALGGDSVWTFNYQSLNLLFGDYINDCKFFKDHTGYAVGTKGIVFRSTDGGVTWTDDHTGTSPLFALSMTDEKNGYAVGAGGTILKRGTATPVEDFDQSAINLSLFPNPAGDQATLSFPVSTEEKATIRITGIDGKICSELAAAQLSKGWNEIQLDLSSLSPGVYVISILTDHLFLRKKMEVIR